MWVIFNVFYDGPGPVYQESFWLQNIGNGFEVKGNAQVTRSLELGGFHGKLVQGISDIIKDLGSCLTMDRSCVDSPRS